MKTEFFTTRTQARTAAKLAGVKPIDNGAGSAQGKRWAICLPSDACPTHVSERLQQRPVIHLHRRSAGDRKYPFSNRASVVMGANGRSVPVKWRKRRTFGASA